VRSDALVQAAPPGSRFDRCLAQVIATAINSTRGCHSYSLAKYPPSTPNKQPIVATERSV
jgi:hypothetical protein